MSFKLIKQATIIDPNSPHSKMVKDILIEDGVIVKIDVEIKEEKNYLIIKEDNLHVCPGLMDFSVDFSDPGNEQKETIPSGCKAAVAGGFTAIGLEPTDSPSRDNKSAIKYCSDFSEKLGVNIFPFGAISKDLKGEQLAEMYDMYQAGALAFTDNQKPIKHGGLLSRALLYTKNFNGMIISFPYDKSISPNGLMHEGETSTLLGLEGIPSLAEELFINRDIAINKYNKGRLHFNIISSKESVSSIANVKSDNLNISCGTSIYHLIFDDVMVEGFNNHFKFLPPLRSKEDRDALLSGVKDGTIDVITSYHKAHEKEITEVEFAISPFGCIGTQVAFPLALTYLQDFLGLEKIIQTMAINPRSVLQTEVPIIKEGHIADITLFNPTSKWVFSKENNLSLSENTPLLNTELNGKVIGTILKEKFHLNN
tara:strand:+ start:1136 stop:2410 length:1275 start_codon:yes stop_codon:yes gene_type:complete